MPALDFPTSPTVGQQYNDWVYDGSKWNFAQTLPGGLPAGSIIQWGGSTAPVNWLLCDGSAVSRTTYASLFAAVGTAYGTGNGSTTFNLPDLRGRVPVGKNGETFGTLGATGGAETVTLTEAQMPSHTHTQNAHNHTAGDYGHSHGGVIVTGGLSVPNGSYYGVWGNYGFKNTDTAYANIYVNNATATNQNTGGGQAHNNLQPYLVTNYIIKATAAVTPGESELAPRVGVLEATNALSSNYVLNSDMEINQRGLTSTPAYKFNSYLTDRWKGVNSELRASIQDTSGSTVPCAKALRLGVNNGESSNMHLAQKLEFLEAKKLRSKTVTLSMYVRFSAATWTPTYGTITSFNFGLGVNTATTDAAINNVTFDSATTSSIANGSFPTSWTRVSVTATIPATANNVTIYTAFNTYFSAANDSLWYEVTGVQLEEGSVATPFRRNQANVQAELAACQRYYYRASSNNGGPYSVLMPIMAQGNTSGYGVFMFPQPMRITPIVIDYANLAACSYGLPHTAITSLSYDSNVCSPLTMGITLGWASYSVARSDFLVLLANNSTSAYIGFSAEL